MSEYTYRKIDKLKIGNSMYGTVTRPPCEIGPGLKKELGHQGYLEGFLMGRLASGRVTGWALFVSRYTGLACHWLPNRHGCLR